MCGNRALRSRCRTTRAACHRASAIEPLRAASERRPSRRGSLIRAGGPVEGVVSAWRLPLYLSVSMGNLVESSLTLQESALVNKGSRGRRRILLVQPDLLVEDLELGLIDVVLHPRLRGLVERRAGDRIPVELVGAELLQLPGDGLALHRIHLPGVARVEVGDPGIGMSRVVRGR